MNYDDVIDFYEKHDLLLYLSASSVRETRSPAVESSMKERCI